VQRVENGNTLVGCAAAVQLGEIAPDGSLTKMAMPGQPYSAQRLENGNTLVALKGPDRVVEVDRGGKIAWEARVNGSPAHAVRLENGNTLVCLTNPRERQ